jgi:hypothetical protein
MDPAEHPGDLLRAPGPPPLVDQYSHGVLHAEPGLGTFEAHLAAAAGSRGGTPPPGSSYFDTHLGRAVRRWCPPLLGLEPHCTPVRYLARRRDLGAWTAGRALLRGSGVRTFLVDTEGRPAPGPRDPAVHGEPVSVPELASAALGQAREVVSLTALARQVADTSGTVGGFLSNCAEALHGAAHGAAAFVGDAAFHEGAAPCPSEVRRAADRWFRARAVRPAVRPVPDEPALARHLVWAALTTGRPVQLRCDDPARLTGLLRATAGRGAALVLLPRPGGHAAGARLAAAFPHVHADAGPDPERTFPEAPAGKLLFSSGAWALPELYVVAARRFGAAVGRLLGTWVEEGCCSRADALRIAAGVAGGNARRLYGLDAASG